MRETRATTKREPLANPGDATVASRKYRTHCVPAGGRRYELTYAPQVSCTEPSVTTGSTAATGGGCFPEAEVRQCGSPFHTGQPVADLGTRSSQNPLQVGGRRAWEAETRAPRVGLLLAPGRRRAVHRQSWRWRARPIRGALRRGRGGVVPQEPIRTAISIGLADRSQPRSALPEPLYSVG